MTFNVGSGPNEHHLRAARWSLEITFGLLALFYWMRDLVNRPELWAWLFMIFAFLGSLTVIADYLYHFEWQKRASGLGAVHHPVQLGPILLIYYAIGVLLFVSVTNKLNIPKNIIISLTFFLVGLAIFLSQSRASIIIFMTYSVYLGLIIFRDKYRLLTLMLVATTFLLLFLVAIDLMFGFETFIDKILERRLSNRDTIWKGYLLFPPDSIFFGLGSGTQPQYHPAYDVYWKPNGYELSATHAHNLFIGTYSGTGLVGLAFLLSIFFSIIRNIFKSSVITTQKYMLLGILGIIFLSTLTSSFTVVSSIKAIWLIFWLPTIFIWFWCRYRETGDN